MQIYNFFLTPQKIR